MYKELQTSFTVLAELSSLAELDLSGNDLTGLSLPEGMSNLTKLNLSVPIE